MESDGPLQQMGSGPAITGVTVDAFLAAFLAAWHWRLALISAVERHKKQWTVAASGLFVSSLELSGGCHRRLRVVSGALWWLLPPASARTLACSRRATRNTSERRYLGEASPIWGVVPGWPSGQRTGLCLEGRGFDSGGADV